MTVEPRWQKFNEIQRSHECDIREILIKFWETRFYALEHLRFIYTNTHVRVPWSGRCLEAKISSKIYNLESPDSFWSEALLRLEAYRPRLNASSASRWNQKSSIFTYTILRLLIDWFLIWFLLNFILIKHYTRFFIIGYH